MEIIAALKEFGITGMTAVLVASLAYLVHFILTRYDADITAKTALAISLQSLAEAIRERNRGA